MEEYATDAAAAEEDAPLKGHSSMKDITHADECTADAAAECLSDDAASCPVCMEEYATEDAPFAPSSAAAASVVAPSSAGRVQRLLYCGDGMCTECLIKMLEKDPK
jgi:hypothetical protein